MTVTMDKFGALVISPENHLEAYALKQWAINNFVEIASQRVLKSAGIVVNTTQG